jgi:DNA-binding NarL/FixJ family response regulator
MPSCGHQSRFEALAIKRGTAGKGVNPMTQRSPPRRRRVLIVDDETSFGIRLEADMHALGYEVCDLATNGQQAFLLAMSDQPDVVLMDVCLEGGREGIEVARRLREVCDATIVFVTGYADRATIERIQERVPGASVLPKSDYRDHLADVVSAVNPH